MSLTQELLNALNSAKLGGKTNSVKPVVTTTAVAYSAGDSVGGAIKVADAARSKNNTVILKSVVIRDDANQASELVLLFFDTQPTATDNAAFAWNTFFDNCVGAVKVLATDYVVVASNAIADVDTMNKVMQVGTDNGDLWMVIVCTGTPSYGANSTDLLPIINFLQD